METPATPDLAARQPDYRRIAESMRREIINGKLAPGTRLPATRELAVKWQSSVFTIHAALQAMVKEGWVERLGRAGTFVADFKNRFSSAGIYHDSDIFADEQTAYARAVHSALLQKFNSHAKEVHVFVDSRFRDKQNELLPALAEAVRNRRINCLIAPSLNPTVTPALVRLQLPTAFPSPTTFSLPSSNVPTCDFDKETMLRESVRRFHREGCHSIGLISNVLPSVDGGPSTFYQLFRNAVRSEGLATRDNWIRMPTSFVGDPERHGYQEFKDMWALRDKPEGLIVYPDTIVRGVVMGVVEIGVRNVAEQMKLIFHRNAHVKIFCPFPVTWAISDEAKLADGLIQLIEMQFRGDKISPILLQYQFHSD